MRLEVSTTTGGVAALTVPSSGMLTCQVDSTSSRNASNSSSARSTSSTSSTAGLCWSAASTGRASRNRSSYRLFSASSTSAPAAGGLERAQVQDLAREVPVVERLGGVDALVALQPDQRQVERLGERLGQRGLAGAGLALEQQRPLHPQRQVGDRRQLVVGEVAGRRPSRAQRPRQTPAPCRSRLRASRVGPRLGGRV